VEKTPNDVYRDVGLDAGLPADDIASIGGLESKHGKYNEPMQGGSARGLFQFQPETAEHLIPGSSDSLEDLDTQSKLMKLYLKKNEIDNIEDAFAKHNLGPGRGEKFISAPDDALISSVIPERVIRSNPSLYNVKTVGEAKKIIKDRLSKEKKDIDTKPNILDLFKGD
jgi:hypothetical protein